MIKMKKQKKGDEKRANYISTLVSRSLCQIVAFYWSTPSNDDWYLHASV